MRYLLLLLLTSLANAADLYIERTGELLRVYTTNNTFRCFWIQWNSDLQTTNWNDWHGYRCATNTEPIRKISLHTTNDMRRVFWRLKECP